MKKREKFYKDELSYHLKWARNVCYYFFVCLQVKLFENLIVAVLNN